MITKLLEVRDEGTFIPVMGTLMEAESDAPPGESYLLRRAGYAVGQNLVLVVKLYGNGERADCSPESWRSRTMMVAHQYIATNWDTLRSGDVVDVEFILGLTAEPKESERVSG